MVSPPVLSVGQELEVLGKDFIQPIRGQATILFKGTYYGENGDHRPVDFERRARCVGSIDGAIPCAKLRWKLWPDIPFHPTGDGLGQFVGTVVVVNAGVDGSREYSAPLVARIQIGPSLIPRMVRPTDAACPAVVGATLEDTPMGLAVEAVGLRAASPEEPLVFTWTFMREQWELSTQHGALDTSPDLSQSGPVSLTQTVTMGRTSVVRDGGVTNYIVQVWQDFVGNERLKTLRTAKLPPEATGSGFATAHVVARDASGKTAVLAIRLGVRPMAEMHYDGDYDVVSRDPPVQVSDCTPGGPIGRTLAYSEHVRDTRSRTLSFNYNVNGGISVAPWPANPFALGINFNVGFGVDVGSTVTSSDDKELNINGQVLPGEYGVFYRQTTEIERVGKLIGYNQCGSVVDLGEAILTDWLFTPELATGPKCTPKSRLPLPTGR